MRKLNLSAKPAAPAKAAKPVAAKAAKPAAPVIAAPVSAPAIVPAERPRYSAGNIAKTLSRVTGKSRRGGKISHRDTGYLTFYAAFAKRATDGVTFNAGDVALAGVPASITATFGFSSDKPHDLDVLNNCVQAGLLTAPDATNNLRFTERAKSFAFYSATPARPA